MGHTKDTEKLVRQLSLIAYLTQRERWVTAAEVQRDVEGYGEMTSNAFARRFYADRAELEALGIHVVKQESSLPSETTDLQSERYTLRKESFHLPAISFTEEELAALHLTLSLLDDRFAYAEPLRVGMQRLLWGQPAPNEELYAGTVSLGVAAAAGDSHERHMLGKIESAIARRKALRFHYLDADKNKKVKATARPYAILYRGSQFFLVGYSTSHKAVRLYRLSRIEAMEFTSKAEHDFAAPEGFDATIYANQAGWQFTEINGAAPAKTATIEVDSSLAWQVERHYGRFGEVEAKKGGGIVFSTEYTTARELISFVFSLGSHARITGPPALVREAASRGKRITKAHNGRPPSLKPPKRQSGKPKPPQGKRKTDKPGVRPERLARLITLATTLIAKAREDQQTTLAELEALTGAKADELQGELEMLNIVNFGAGSYCLYVEVTDDGRVIPEAEPYADSFERPARLLPSEARAIIAALEIIGDRVPNDALGSARAKIIEALGIDPLEQGLVIAHSETDDRDLARVCSRAIAQRKRLKIDYYKPGSDEITTRTIEPYMLTNGLEGWYVAAYEPRRKLQRHFRLDRIRTAKLTGQTFERNGEVARELEMAGWRSGENVEGAQTAQVLVMPERALDASERFEVLQELQDGSIIVAMPFAGVQWLAGEILREAGECIVLEPETAREAVKTASLAIGT